MKINQYLESTYLKTAKQANLSDQADIQMVKSLVEEAISNEFKVVMIRPNHVVFANELVNKAKSKVLIGTVIDFPKGKGGLEKKLSQAKQAIIDGADELDFVVDYKAFKKKNISIVKEEILICTNFCIDKNKTIKWIIETAALNKKQIIQLSALVKNLIISNFKEENFGNVYVKSSTGFFKTKNNEPNGATFESIIMMLENASPLPIKASGGIKNCADANNFIKLGVKRIGTSSAKIIADESQVILK